MYLSEIYHFLDELSPFATQAKWDNSGIIIGNKEAWIDTVYLSLDVDASLLEHVEEGALIITHHPLIFSGLKQLDFARYPSSLIQTLICKKISLIAMHTNFDLSHLNSYVIHKLGFRVDEVKEFVGYFTVNQPFDELMKHVKETIGLPLIRVVKTKEWVGRCALTTGSGGELISSIDADCFLTGDLKYHQAFEAKENNLSLIDIGHFESERYFPECLIEHLKNLPLKVIMSNSKNPFEYK